MKKLTVVISQSQGKNPAHRQLEEDVAAPLLMDRDIDASLVPHLYDMSADHTGMLFLRSLGGDVVVLSWLYPRAVRWILDRNGVHGKEGLTLLKSDDEDEDEIEEAAADEEPRGIGSVDVPNRRIYCIDLRASSNPQEYLEEIRRIALENAVQTVQLAPPPGGNGQTIDLMQFIQGSPKPEQMERYLGGQESRVESREQGGNGNGNGKGELQQFDAPVKRRWYPVIDYTRCTNCMECIDFCLFGVYGVDLQERILVEQQDNCKKGCPACSRVCPENAIIFPGHKTPAIAGADGEVAGLKIDLSKLFGAPGKSAIEMAVAERDTELVRDGRDAVGMSVGIPKRQEGRDANERDELDDLMDGLDELDL